MDIARRFIYIVTLLLTLTQTIKADVAYDEPFRFITQENGLSGETVASILTDHLGQVWPATSNGVSRYNGKRIVTFSFNGEGRGATYVFDLCEDRNGTLYAATTKGIFILQKGANHFKRILPSIAKAETVLASAGVLYIGNRDGLHLYDGKHLRTITVGATKMGIENSVRDIVPGKNGVIWFLTRYALNSYNAATGKVRSVNLATAMPPRAALSHLCISGEHFYVGTKNNGLFVYDFRKRQSRHVEGIVNVITYLYTTRQGDVCVSTDGSGAFLLDGHNAIVKQHFTMGGDKAHNLPTDACYCYYRDDNGVDWFGFYRFGLAYTYHSDKIFRSFRMGDFSTEGLFVRSFCIHGSETVIGTGAGVYYVNTLTRQVRHIKPEQLGGAHIITKICYFNGMYYIGTYDAGVRVFNPATGSVSTLTQSPLLSNVTASALAVAPDGNLWMGTGEGVFVLSPQGRLTAYNERNTPMKGGVVTDIFFDSKGNGWICSQQGLSLYSFAEKQFESSHFPKGFFDGEESLRCCAGHDGLLFFYNRQGIYFTDLTLNRFGSTQMPQGLENEVIYSFLDDRQGHFWMATGKGLFRFDYQGRELQHFGYGEGLQCQLVGTSDILRTKTDEIWMGTSNGLLFTTLSAIDNWRKHTHYPILLYDLYVGSDPLDYAAETLANEEHHISLTWNLLSEKLSFKIVVEDFARPYGRFYQYRLDGAQTWTLVQDGLNIVLSHLSIGGHSLEVRLAGAPGTTRTYHIAVYPSWLAIMELVLLLIAIVLFFWWRRYHKTTDILLAERNDIADALMEVENEQQQTQMQQEMLAEKVQPQQGEMTVSVAEGKLQSSTNAGKQPDDAPKYDRVKINEQECAYIVKRMKTYIEKEKIYENPDLKMSDLADHLHLSPSKLSQVFSLYIKENYYDFINRYRLEAFKRLVDQGETERYTLLALSAKCGFKKSSFFSTFRKVEGMTPTEYLKKMK